ncbi:MAG: hypothetical protein KUG77_12155 [Nannocystaceae bacterium]|nr:hypothetical protein [Nannocystaceae bacterium]
MKSARLALLLFCFPVACDSASEPTTASAERAASTPGTPVAQAAKPAPLKLPAGAEAGATALKARHDPDKGFSGDLSAKDLPGLLWLAAHGEKPLLVADAFHEAAGLITLDEKSEKTLAESAAQTSLSRLDDASIDVVHGALDLLSPMLSADTVDPTVVSALERMLVGGSSQERKVLAASTLHQITFDTKSALGLTATALASDEPAVVVTTLSWMPRLRAERPALTQLIQPFLKHENPAHVGAALQAFARNADKSAKDALTVVEPFLRSKDGYVRAHALSAYAKLAGKTAASAIAANLDNRDAIADRRIAHPREDGTSAKAGPYLAAKEVRQAAVNAIRYADSSASISVDWHKPESADAAYTAAKAWAKKTG